MNENAESAIKSLIKAREFMKSNIPAHWQQEDVDGVWEGYLTVVAAVYSVEPYELIHKIEMDSK